MIKRCAWLDDNPLMLAYHDREWGVPVRDDRELFERWSAADRSAPSCGSSWEANPSRTAGAGLVN